MKGQGIDKGRLAETAVADYLQEQGYQICARNYLVPRLGELDLVAWRDGQLAIVEVKARSDASAYGGLPETITPGKIKRIRRAALCFLKEKHMMNIDVSILAALVKIDNIGKALSIDIVPVESV